MGFLCDVEFVVLNAVVVEGSKVVDLEPGAKLVELAEQKVLSCDQERGGVIGIYDYVDERLIGSYLVLKEDGSGSGSVVVSNCPKLHGKARFLAFIV